MASVQPDTWVDQVVLEHDELRALISDLRGFLEKPRPQIGSKGFHTWAAGLSSRLVTLHDKLYRHFRYEEHGGMMPDLASRFPRAVTKIESLLGQHALMLKEVREVMTATLRYSEGKTPQDQRLRRRLKRLLDFLAKHEEDEMELIQNLNYQDIGSVD
jgi:hypothetical protein